ncbi:MAG: sigma-70 family RNA polymerase sigma factor [Planctomycetes bacterium]|nr:sigma-70 family RNA polymerase sigma factor [Planctomycetota bacterium]
MSDASANFDPEQLSAQRAFVRALARRLVLGDDAAEELTQQTIVAAWSARPEPRTGLRGWLAKVALRLRDRGQRDAHRRARRERDAAAPEAQPSAADLAAQIELCERVARAVAQLSEPYRSTLFLRYWHDLSPSEIAARDDLPVATVKSRLQRALAQLRGELDAAHGGRRDAWAGVVVGWWTVGGAAMSSGAKVGAAAGLIVAATLAWRLVAPIASGGVTTPALAKLDATPSAADGSAAAVDEAAAANAPIVERIATVTSFASGIVVDPHGQPLEGVCVVPRLLHRAEARNLFAAPLIDDEVEARAIARSDASGAFVVAEMPADAVVLVLAKEGWQSGEWTDFDRDGTRNQSRRFVLQPGRSIAGCVRDRQGRPLADALIHWSRASNPQPIVAGHLDDAPTFHPGPLAANQYTCTDRDGRFRFTRLPASLGALIVMADDHAVLSEPEDGITVEYVVSPPRDSALFIVSDSSSGAPLPGATALVRDATTGEAIDQLPRDSDDRSSFTPRTSTPARLALWVGCSEGWFPSFAPWLPAKGDSRELIATLHVPGYRTRELPFTISREIEPPRFEVAVVPATSGDDAPIALSGRIAGAKAATLELRAATVAAGRSDLVPEWSPPLLRAMSDEAGAFELRGAPAGRYRLDARATGCAPLTRLLDLPARDVRLDFVAAASALVTVVDRHGVPQCAIDVQLQTADGLHARLARTDAAGRARFAELPPGECFVAAFPAGLRHTRYDADRRARPLNPETFLASEQRTLIAGEQVEFELPIVEAEPVALLVHDREARPLSDVELRFELADDRGAGLYRLADGLAELRERLTRSDLDGRAATSLPPGNYFVRAAANGVESRTLLAVAPVVGGNAQIVLPLVSESGRLHGRLVEFGSGLPLPDCPVRAFQRGSAALSAVEFGSAISDEKGEFTLEHLPAGPLDLVAWGSAERGMRRTEEPTHHSTDVRVVIVADQAIEIEVPIAAIAQEPATGAERVLELLVRDARSGAPLAGGHVQLAACQGDARVHLGGVSLDKDGGAKLSLRAAEGFTLTIDGPRDREGARLYQKRTIELGADALPSRLEADLEPLERG